MNSGRDLMSMKAGLSVTLVALVAMVVGAGCATPRRAPVLGLIYTDSTAGLAATSSPAGNRVGESCVSSILGIYSKGDASIEAARRNGGITMISSVDEAFTSYLGVYGKHCTIVR